MTRRRLEVLAALALGCAAGWSLCTATACGTAAAGGSGTGTGTGTSSGTTSSAPVSTTVQCVVTKGSSGYSSVAVQAYPGLSDIEVASRVTAAWVFASPMTGSPGAPQGINPTAMAASVYSATGVAMVGCEQFSPTAGSVVFTLH